MVYRCSCSQVFVSLQQVLSRCEFIKNINVINLTSGTFTKLWRDQKRSSGSGAPHLHRFLSCRLGVPLNCSDWSSFCLVLCQESFFFIYINISGCMFCFVERSSKVLLMFVTWERSSNINLERKFSERWRKVFSWTFCAVLWDYPWL